MWGGHRVLDVGVDIEVWLWDREDREEGAFGHRGGR